MKWTPGTDNDDVVDVRGRRGGGGGGRGRGMAGGVRLGGGGLVAVVAIVLVARLLGYDVSGLLGSEPGGDPRGPGAAPAEPRPPSGPDPDKELVEFVRFVMKDIQDTFDEGFRAEGQPYRRAKLYLFTDEIDTGCGRSSSAIGPFYCPADEHAYIDLSFYRDLRKRFGAPGDFAQAYVLAHEIGHHLQNILGTEDRARRRGGPAGSRNEASVRVELQADCYAGVWAHTAAGKNLLEAGDLEEALTAAAAIGDDRLQRQSGGEVNPETFTHGSSAQRMRWFRKGFEAGELAACDTFSATKL